MQWPRPKARASDISHHLFPDLVERMTATVFKRESQKGMEVEHTTGTLFEPMQEGSTVEGGIRERMAKEDQRD